MEEEINGVAKGGYSRYKWINFFEEARKRRDSENNLYTEYETEFVDYMQRYANDKEDELKSSLKYYKDAITTKFFDKNYATLNERYIKYALSMCKVMVITANPIEKAILHHKIIDNGAAIIIRILCGTTAYYVFQWGKYWVAHIHQSQTGAGKDMGTNATIGDALKFFTPNVIIALGIAFGIDYDTQNIGDVLVSRRLLPYSENKRDKDNIKPDRTQDKTIDDWLHVRLENAVGFLDGVTYGDILSGGSVMSSFKEKDRVCLGYTKVDYIIGGEMEGNAVFQYAKRMDIPGVVIKGICDWGVAKNDIFEDNPNEEEKLKNSLQAFAMKQTVEKCKPLFNDKALFSSSKNIANKKLKNKYFFCLYGLIISQLLIMIHSLYLLLCNYDYVANVYILDSFVRVGKFLEKTSIWLATSLILLLTFFVVFLINTIPKLIWRIYVRGKRFWSNIKMRDLYKKESKRCLILKNKKRN